MAEYIFKCDNDMKNPEWKEQIVRCKDCEHYRFIDRSGVFNDERHNDSFCLRFVSGKFMEVEPDGFCKWGERR